MKYITTFSKRVYAIEDDEAGIVEGAIGNGGFVKLRSGDLLNTSAIESIGSPPQAKFYKGQPVLSGGKIVNSYGNLVSIESPDEIYFADDPSYQTLGKQKKLT